MLQTVVMQIGYSVKPMPYIVERKGRRFVHSGNWGTCYFRTGASIYVADSAVMADSDESLGIDVSSLSINENGTQADPDEYHEKWGFNLPDLYKLALKFYKGTQTKHAPATFF